MNNMIIIEVNRYLLKYNQQRTFVQNILNVYDNLIMNTNLKW